MASESSSGPLKELATSRARFIAELGERIAAIRQALGRVGTGADLNAELNAVRRRLHALAAAADVLHFTAAADALRRAEDELGALASAPSPAPARERVAHVLDLIPSLALGAAIDLGAELDGERTRSAREPLSVLVFGDEALADALHRPGPLHGAETLATTELEQLPTLVLRLGPDAVLLDGDDPEIADQLPRLRQAAGSVNLPFVAVGNFESYEGMLRLIRRGVSRVLPRPVDAAALQRTLRQLVPRELPVAPRANPFRAVPAGGLIELIGSEAGRAFTDPALATLPALTLGTEDGNRALAALWSGFARIRVLAARAAPGALRFPLEGPDGMIPLAPAIAPPGREPAATTSVGEALAGRRLVVADADPMLLGVLSRALQRLGASVLPARDGAQALDLVERHWPDALISDALLPHVDGFALCRTIRDDIALGDLPVALVCWKEDLIELARRSEHHTREGRGVDPDGFAPLAEALAKRVTLERRLERHEAVHGRLDGLSPRLLLQLGCSRTPSSVVRVRAGRLAVEVAIVDGRPIHARLLDGAAIQVEGAGALGAFLGMRLGRFSVEPLSEPPPALLSGDVMTVLAPAIARARRARAWLSTHALEEVERVELDPRVAALYLEEAPAAQKMALMRLLRGESLRALLDTGDAVNDAAPALAALLLELARRGALLALIERGGRDLLDPEAASGPAARATRARADGPTPVMPAAMTLAEAVLQAVSASSLDPDRPSARRTHPGLAPPAPLPTRAAGSAARRAGPGPGEQPHDGDSRADASAETDTAIPGVAEAGHAPRGAGSAQPEHAQAIDARARDSEQPDRDSEQPRDSDSAPPAAVGTRIRGVLSPVLVTAAAGALAFVGMRVILGGGLDQLGVLPSAPVLANAGADAGALRDRSPLDALRGRDDPLAVAGDPTPTAADAPADRVAGRETPDAAAPDDDAGAPPQSLQQSTSQSPHQSSPEVATPPPATTLEADVTTELLDPAAGVLAPGQGQLEVQTWEPQSIYINDLFAGTHASHVIPLRAGIYRVRLRSGTRAIEHAVRVEAGRRTRLSASARATP